MKIPIWGLFVIVVAVPINNVAWFYYAEQQSMKHHLSLEQLSDQRCDACEMTTISSGEVMSHEAQALSTDPCPKMKINIDDDNKGEPVSEAGGALSMPSTLEAPDTFEIDVPIEASQAYFYERDIARDQFYAAGFEGKLDIVQSLSAQGEDLDMIDKIIESDNDSNIKAAAIVKLTNEHSFAATMVLIKALEDPVEDVVLTALSTIVANGDRTLVPMLQQKVTGMPEGTIRDEFIRSIHGLEYSVTMDMDGIQNGQ